jgi:hypothetical protein
MTLYASSGGSGSFGYHWAPEALVVNPNAQSTQTFNLNNTTVFVLMVTNLSSLCQSQDQKVVYISGGPLTVNPTAMPSSLCQGASSQLFANAGGGSGNYTYTWTCTPPGIPPWTSGFPNPSVTPDSTTIYHLSVYDGFNTTTGSTQVTVFQLPTAAISGGDTLCGEGLSTPLVISLTGEPPWTFIYTNGLNTFTVSNQMTTPYVTMASQPGTYTLIWVHDIHCQGTTSGSAVVAIFPIPPTPEISQVGNQLFSTACCGNQWYKDGAIIPGGVNQSFTPSQTAHYFDIVTLNGCSSDTSNDIYFVMTGILNPGSDQFRIIPDPAKDFIRVISRLKNTKEISVTIFSLTGIKLKEYPGIYLVSVRSETGSEIKKLVISN